jgi:hypothetical protein
MTTFDLYWSPEGRKIATVDAKDRKSAIRKAPKPYNCYPGEIYAFNAFEATVSIWSDGLLLGGTKRHVSSAFESKEDAEAWAQQAVEVNRDRPGYKQALIDYAIEPVYSKNPIPKVN